MNRIELITKRNENRRKLTLNSLRNVNKVVFGSESIGHKLGKTIGFIFLRAGIEAEQLQSFFNDPWWQDLKMIEWFIEKFGQKFKHWWKRPHVVTEAEFTTQAINYWGKKIDRRADLFLLDNGKIVEIETNHKIKKEGAITVYI